MTQIARSRRARRAISILMAASAASTTLIGAARAANLTWSGGGGDDKWSTGGNWAGTAPVANDTIFFGGTTRLTPDYDLGNGTSFGGITFNAGAGSFNLGSTAGQGIVLAAPSDAGAGTTAGGSITQNSANAQTFGTMGLTLAAGQHVVSTANNTGALNFTAPVTRNPNSTVLFTKGGTAGGNINFATTTGLSVANGILGGWALFGSGNAAAAGTDWATLDGSNNVVAYTAYTTLAANNTNIASSAASNVKQTNSGGTNALAAAGTTDINTFLYASTANQTVNPGTGNILRFGAKGGIMNANGNASGRTLTIGTSTAAGGTITAGGADNTAGELTLIDLGLANTTNSMNINSVIADNGTGVVSVNVLGYVIISNANTFTGGTFINQGRVQAANLTAFGASGSTVTVSPGGQAFLNTSGTWNNYFVLSGVGSSESGGLGAIRLNGANRNLAGPTSGANSGIAINLAGTAALGGSGNITGKITGPGGLIIGSGTAAGGNGTVTISGSAAGNDYQGNTQIGSNNSSASNALQINTGKNTIMPHGSGTGNLILNAQSATVQATFDLNGTTQTINGLSSTATSPANDLITSAAAGGVLSVGDNNANATFGGIIQGAANLALTKIGNGTQTLSGANTYTGNTTVNAGTLAIAGAGSLAAGSAVTVGATGTLGVAGTVGGNVTNNGTVNVTGTIGGSVSNTGLLAGSGTVSGPVTVNNGGRVTGGVNGVGTLTLNGNVAVGAGAGDTAIFNVTPNTGSTTTASVLVGGAATLTLNGNAASVAVNVTGAAPPIGSYVLIDYTGALGGTGFSAFALGTLPPRVVANLVDDAANTSVDLNVTAVDFPVWSGAASSEWSTNAITPPKNWVLNSDGVTSTDYLEGDSVVFNDSASGTTTVDISVADVSPSSVLFNNGSKNYTLTGSKGIVGLVGLVKNGTGSLSINNANGYTGGTTLNAGTLNINNANAIGSGALKINGGALGNTSGSPVTLATNNAQTWAGDFAFTGTSDLNLGSGAVTLNANPTITVTANTLSVGGVIANGSGNSITKAGGGTLLLGGANTYTGATTVTAGTLTATNNAALGNSTSATGGLILAPAAATTATVQFTSAAPAIASLASSGAGTSNVVLGNTAGVPSATTLTVGGGGTSTAFAGTISDLSGTNAAAVGHLAKTGAGTFTLTGANTYTGTTSLAGGTLALSGGDNRLPTGTTLAFTGSATLDIGSTNQTVSTITVPDAAAITSSINGTGTLTVNGAKDLELGPANPAGATTLVTLSMAGLSNFVYNAPANAFRVGMKVTNNATSNTAQNSLITLASTNTITASVFAVADQGGARNPGLYTLHLGQTNILNANTFNIADSGRSGATLDFASGLVNPTVKIRGTDGTSAAGSFTIGRVTNNANTVWTETVDFSAGSVDALLTSMLVASADTGTQTGRQGTVNSSFIMGAGSVTVPTLTIGRITNGTGGTVGGAFVANGTVTINNAAGTLNAATITLADNTITESSANTKTVSGTLALTSGTVKATTIQRGSTIGNATATATVNWDAGTIRNTDAADLTITGGMTVNLNSSGTHSLNISSGQTGTIASSVSLGGSGALTKDGGGTLVMNNTATYGGDTTINQGIMRLGSASAIPATVLSFAPSSGSATLQLNGNNSSVSGLQTTSTGGSSTVENANPAPATFTVNNASDFTFAGDIRDGAGGGALSVTKSGSGTQSIKSVRLAGTLTVNGGKLLSLPHGGPDGVSVVNSTVITAGLLDINNNHLIDRTTAVGSAIGGVYDGMSGLIQSGRNGGGWTGTTGIVTSQTDATTGNFTSIGIATGAQVKGIATTATAVWAGQTVTGTDTLVMYTYGGDANLDGKINVDDYGHIDSSIPLGIAGWFNGDFNYDGKINVDDYGIIDFNIGIQGAPFYTGAGIAATPRVAGLSGVSAVPEPTSLSLLALGSAAAFAIRRRRRR